MIYIVLIVPEFVKDFGKAHRNSAANSLAVSTGFSLSPIMWIQAIIQEPLLHMKK
jgi:hypothetical protein